LKINKIAYNAREIESLYDHVNGALRHLGRNFIGKAKIELRLAKKDLEKIRPHLKNRGIR
jgi:hypothetical protein